MGQPDLRTLQLFELEMLKDVKKVCEAQGLTYYLYSGTLLGAVRHRGFIPWDDDIDIAMPYDDFLRFLEVGQQALGDRYFLQTTDTDESFQFGYARVRRNGTTMIREWECEGGHHGVWIDVFPLISVGGKADVRLKKLLIPLANTLCMTQEAFCLGRDWMCKTTGRTKVALISLLRKLLGKRRKRVAKWIRRKLYSQTGKANCAEAWGSITAVVPAEAFRGGPVSLPFEDDEFRVPPDYDCVLRHKYGNYMELPPEDKRRGNHGDMVIDLERDWETVRLERPKTAPSND